MFSKINTKTDHVAAFKKSIDAAISEAEQAHVGNEAIVSYLRSQAQIIEDQSYRGSYVPTRMYDGSGKPIDTAKQVADARAARQAAIDAASIIPVDQRQVAASGYRK